MRGKQKGECDLKNTFNKGMVVSEDVSWRKGLTGISVLNNNAHKNMFNKIIIKIQRADKINASIYNGANITGSVIDMYE